MPPYIPPNTKKPITNPTRKPWTRPLFSSTISSSSSSPTSTNNELLPQGSNDKRKSRLREAPIQNDPLESAGLPSKGDTTLLNHAAQESYYTLLTSRYMDWCAASGNPCVVAADITSSGGAEEEAAAAAADLSQSFDDMSLDGSSFYATTTTTTAAKPNLNQPTMPPAFIQKELSTIHMSMRKLREALLSTGRTDAFAQQVYLFITRASLLSRTFESYHPALLHLLYVLHPRLALPLSSSTLHELVAYQILDTACRLGDYGEAYALRAQWRFTDRKVDGILRALVRDDWLAFWHMRDELDGYQRALVRWAEDGVRKHVFKCVGRAYLSVERRFVERGVGCLGRERRARVIGEGVERVVDGGNNGEEVSWGEIVRQHGVGWEEEGGMLVIRRVKNAVKMKS